MAPWVNVSIPTQPPVSGPHHQVGTMTDSNFETMRTAMINSQLRTTDVNTPSVLSAIAGVAREAFVPAGYEGVAYMDRALPFANGRMLNPPISLGLMLERAVQGPLSRVLIVGSGTGYAAAVLSALAGHVVALEEDAALIAQARGPLSAYQNIEMVEGPLTDGYAAGAPYSLILVDGAVEEVPPALAAQLAEGGRLLCGLVTGAITRLAEGLAPLEGQPVALHPFADTEIAPLPSFGIKRAFTF